MQMLKLVVVGMAVLIVGGTATLAVLIIRRVSVPTAGHADLALAQPAGTRLTGIAAIGQTLAVSVQGGGADRILLVSPQTGRVLGRILLTPAP